MNFDKAVVSNKPHIAALHNPHDNLHAYHPIARHAYRLSQVITFGVVTPQSFVH